MEMKAKKDYPLNFEEFEQRIIELLLEEYGDTDSRVENLLKFVDRIKAEDNNDYIKSLYSDSCYRYDKYGNDAFDDESLIAQPVRLLYMLYGD